MLKVSLYLFIGVYIKMLNIRILTNFILLLTALFSFCVFSKGSSVHVNGYFRSNGTYVQPHYRSAPDHNFYNNWSTKGNTNPYTGKIGAKEHPYNSQSYQHVEKTTPHLSTTNSTTSNHLSLESNSPTKEYTYTGENFMEIQKRKDVQRALYWKQKGYNFDPNYTTSYMMDQKVKDIERARYWKSQGYDFDPNYTTGFMMDQKVKDIQRARYWKTKGYNFNSDYMTGFMMDQKVKDIQRAAYWKTKGLDFNPDYMTNFMMDIEARNKGVH
ncbi:hypothetical protein [Lelliottia aquatilis]|uniref:hypothetical protein n=1 Tax=Lelliottia aquatilis TaxID=2080838 RepID=UPI00192C44CF|nr:hypothetical protein [Lelliottia aquatilis]MBL5885546.1 hypothetical protein [Lelliottia aquatilis]